MNAPPKRYEGLDFIGLRSGKAMSKKKQGRCLDMT